MPLRCVVVGGVKDVALEMADDIAEISDVDASGMSADGVAGAGEMLLLACEARQSATRRTTF